MKLAPAIAELGLGALLITKAISGATWRQILDGQAAAVYNATHGDTSGTRPSLTAPGVTAATLTHPQTATSAQLMRQFMNAGLSRAGAAALVGNFTQESSLDPNLDKTGSGEWAGTGLASWTDSRAQALFSYAQQHALPWNSVKAQVGYAMLELEQSYPSLLAQLQSGQGGPQQLALEVSQQYERPKAQYADNANREAYAQAAYNQMGG